jgi:hypothetical protein
MDLAPFVEKLRQDLAAVAEVTGTELADRLTAPLESAIRLTLLDVLSTAAEDLTQELAPATVDLRLRRGEPDFVVTTPPGATAEPESRPMTPVDATDGAMSRINLRLPEQLKTRVEEASSRDGLSVNGWLVRAATDALDRTDQDQRRATRGQRYTGWVR